MCESKISLFLMGYKGWQTLIALVEQGSSQYVDIVVISSDLSVREDYYQQIINECNKNNIRFVDKKNDFDIVTIYSIAISWRWIIKTTDEQTLIILHDSLLPKLRGFNPLVTALINKHEKIGVTAIFATEEYDKGDIVDFESINVNYPIKIKKAIELIAICYESIVCRLLNKIINGIELDGFAQDEQEATYSLWRNDDDYILDWNQSAECIVNFINAVGYPYNGARVYCKYKAYVIEDSEVIGDVVIENRTPGKVIRMDNNKPIVTCGEGLLQINKLVDLETRESALPLKNFRIRF